MLRSLVRFQLAPLLVTGSLARCGSAARRSLRSTLTAVRPRKRPRCATQCGTEGAPSGRWLLDPRTVDLMPEPATVRPCPAAQLGSPCTVDPVRRNGERCPLPGPSPLPNLSVWEHDWDHEETASLDCCGAGGAIYRGGCLQQQRFYSIFFIVDIGDRCSNDEHHVAPICNVDGGMADSGEQYPLPHARSSRHGVCDRLPPHGQSGDRPVPAGRCPLGGGTRPAERHWTRDDRVSEGARLRQLMVGPWSGNGRHQPDRTGLERLDHVSGHLEGDRHGVRGHRPDAGTRGRQQQTPR